VIGEKGLKIDLRDCRQTLSGTHNHLDLKALQVANQEYTVLFEVLDGGSIDNRDRIFIVEFQISQYLINSGKIGCYTRDR
jgi:hypothetical protein